MMSNLRFSVIILLSIVAPLMFVSGCGGRARPAGFPRIYHCSVIITSEGVPVVDAFVYLHRQDEPVGWTVSGRTDEDGKALIFTHTYYEGVPKGHYKVTVRKLQVVTPPLPAVMPTNPRQLEKLMDWVELNTTEVSLIKDEFAKPETTPLELNVERKCTATFDVGKLRPVK